VKAEQKGTDMWEIVDSMLLIDPVSTFKTIQSRIIYIYMRVWWVRWQWHTLGFYVIRMQCSVKPLQSSFGGSRFEIRTGNFTNRSQ
jgi:hypothetical protein